MRYFSLPFITILISFSLYTQQVEPEKSLLSKEIFDHYQIFKIEDIRQLNKTMETDVISYLAQVQKLLNNFYGNHPATFRDEREVNIESTLERQYDPDYKVNPRLDLVLEKLKKKQIPGLIKNAPNIFELHHGFGKALLKAEDNGVLFTKNPFRAAYHYMAALRYRSLKLSPEVWTDRDRLLLLNDLIEKEDAERFLKVSNNLAKAEREFIETKRKLFSQEDNLVRTLNDPGKNEPIFSQNKKTLFDLEQKVSNLRSDFQKEIKVFENYAAKYNKFSADFLLEFSDIIISIDESLQEKEKILNDKEYYRTNFNFTFNQIWKLESRKSSYIDLLEMASLLDPENPNTRFRLGQEYYLSGDKLMAISSYKQALNSDITSKKLTNTEKLKIYRDLGGLYYSTKRYVDSAYYYTQELSLEENNSTKLQLAKIHTENTGNYEEAKRLLVNLLENYTNLNKNSPVEEADSLRQYFELNGLLITVFQKTSSPEELDKILEKSKNIHDQINLLIRENYDVLREREKSLAEARINLRINPDDLSMQNFYTIEQDYENQKSVLQKLESIRKTMDFKKIYFTMAQERESSHNITGAIDAYRLAESFGLDPDYARREILRLQEKFK